MTEPGRGHVSEALEQNGLEGPAFDVAALADGLAALREEGKELDRLLEGRVVGDVTAFDPGWR